MDQINQNELETLKKVLVELGVKEDGVMEFIKRKINDDIIIDKNGNITKLDLDRNQLNGQIPKEIGNLSALEKLYLSNSQLNGQIPLGKALPELYQTCSWKPYR